MSIKKRKIRSMKAFTLIELLVVISIIALLLSILLPALGNAREQARLLSCQANCRQIAIIVECYRSDNCGAVPVVYNFATPGVAEKMKVISLAFYGYANPKAKPLPTSPINLDRNTDWNFSALKQLTYYEGYMEKYYSCPFVSGKKAATWTMAPDIHIGDTTYKQRIRKGLSDSYITWLWREFGKKRAINTPNHPLGLPNGRQKFGCLNWNTGEDRFPYPQAPWKDAIISGGRIPDVPQKKWSTSDLRAISCSSMSEAAILFCAQGQWDNWSNVPGGGFIANYGSHRKKGVGGTNVILGDGHVEWVPGTQVGWH